MPKVLVRTIYIKEIFRNFVDFLQLGRKKLHKSFGENVLRYERVWYYVECSYNLGSFSDEYESRCVQFKRTI